MSGKQDWTNSICRFEGVEKGAYLILDNKFDTQETKTSNGFMSLTTSTPFYHLVVFSKPTEYCGSVDIILRQEFSSDDKQEAIYAFNDKVIDIIYGRNLEDL